MKTANLENCKKLYELTGWEDANAIWAKYSLKAEPVVLHVAFAHRDELMILSGQREFAIPAYDLDYLVMSTPIRGEDITTTFMLGRNTDNTGWCAVYKDFACIAEEPADAVCKLLIKIYEWKK